MSFVVSEGTVKGLARPSYAGFNQFGALRMHSTQTMTYEAIWRQQPAVRTVVGQLARAVASTSLGVYKGGLTEQDRERDRAHPLEQLLRNPMPGGKLTKYRLLESMIIERGIYDNALWLKLKADETSPTGALLPIPWRMFRVPDEETDWAELKKYRIQGERGYIDVPAENIVHFHGYNPLDGRVGVSALETLRAILAEEFSAQTYRAQLWRNGARFAGYISRPAEARRWEPAARQRFTESWRAQYAGDVASWLYGGGTPILEDGMAFVPAGVTPKDAQYIESRKLTREEVADAFFLPRRDGVNPQDERETLYRDTLPPWCQEIEQDISNQLLHDIDPSSVNGSVFVEFDLQSKLAGGFIDQAKVLQSAVGGPYITPDEARKKINLPHVEGGDKLIKQQGGRAGPADTAPNDPNNEGSNDPNKAEGLPGKNKPTINDPKAKPPVPVKDIERMERSVLSRFGANAPINWDRWVEEFGGQEVLNIQAAMYLGDTDSVKRAFGDWKLRAS